MWRQVTSTDLADNEQEINEKPQDILDSDTPMDEVIEEYVHIDGSVDVVQC